MFFFTLFLCSIINTTQSSPLNIVYTNDTEGSVTTCGCAKDPGGGVTRRLNWLKDAKLDPINTVYINAGNTIFNDLPSLAHEDKAERFGADIVFEAMSLMGIDAFTPGKSDFKKGVEYFKTASNKVPTVISNSDDTTYKKSVVFNKGENKIVVLGIIQPEILDQTNSIQLRLNDPVKALKNELKNITKNLKQKPYIILLLFSDEEGLKKIAKQAKGVDLILSAGIQEETPQALNLNGVNVIRLLNGGDSIGLFNTATLKNEITFLGPKFERKNQLSAKVKKYEGLKK